LCVGVSFAVPELPGISESIFFFALIAGVIYFFADIVFWARRRWTTGERRTVKLRAIARGWEFSFSPDHDPSLRERLPHSQLFWKGDAQTARNILRRQRDNLHLTIFDYWFDTRGPEGGAERTAQTVILFESDNLLLPAFTLRPKNVFDRLCKTFRLLKESDFDSRPEFSRRYSLQGLSGAEVRELFTPRVLSHFETLKSVCLEVSGSRLVYYRAGKVVAPERIPEFVIEGAEVLSLLAPGLSEQIAAHHVSFVRPRR
jgi:hypothetical protein